MRKPELWQRRSMVVENFQKHGDSGWRITYIYYSFSSGFRKYSRDTTGPYSLFLSVSLSPSAFLSIVNPARTRGWIPACPRSQGPPRRNYERNENRERRDRICFTSVIFSFPTGAGTSARNNVNNRGSGL